MKEPFVNIVIVTFNTWGVTEHCVTSLLNCGYSNLKLYLVDNGSEGEDFNNFYQKNKNNKKLVFIGLKKNIGFGGGCNAALRKIKDGYIVILSNDVEVAKGWLNPMIDFMEKNPEVGACQPKVRNIKQRDYFEYAGAAGGFMDIYGFPFSRGRIFFNLEKDYGQYDDRVDVVWCSGVAIVTKKEVIDKIGYFDEIFFLYAEEADFCWRIHHAGYRLVVIPESIVYHYGTKKSVVDKTFYNHRNGLIMLIKNYSNYELIRYFPIRLFFDFIAFFYYLFGYTPNCVNLIRAYLSLFSLLPKVIQRRAELNKQKQKWGKPKFKYPLYPKSIIVEYFLKGKKTFKELISPYR